MPGSVRRPRRHSAARSVVRPADRRLPWTAERGAGRQSPSVQARRFPGTAGGGQRICHHLDQQDRELSIMEAAPDRRGGDRRKPPREVSQ